VDTEENLLYNAYPHDRGFVFQIDNLSNLLGEAAFDSWSLILV